MEFSEMTYDDYRKQFATKSEFEDAFGRLTKEEAWKLVKGIGPGTSSDIDAMHDWQRLHRIAIGGTWVTKEMTRTFDEAWTIDEYKEIIRICLMDYCDWSEYWRDVEYVNELIDREIRCIREEYADHDTPMDCAIDIGYCCG